MRLSRLCRYSDILGISGHKKRMVYDIGRLKLYWQDSLPLECFQTRGGIVMLDWQIGLLLMLGSTLIVGTIAAFKAGLGIGSRIEYTGAFVYYIGALILSKAPVVYGGSVLMYAIYASATVIIGLFATAVFFFSWLILFFLFLLVRDSKFFD